MTNCSIVMITPFLNVKFISGSPMFPSLTLTIRPGKGVNVTLTVLWNNYLSSAFFGHIMRYASVWLLCCMGLKSLSIYFPLLNVTIILIFFSRKCTTSPVVMPPGFYCCKRGCSAVYWDYLLLLSRKAGLWCLQKQSTIAWGGCKGSWS